MSNQTVLERAISGGLRYLAGVQQKSGDFLSFSSPTQAPFTPSQPYQTTFAPSLILAALAELSSQDAIAIRNPLAQWLQAQKSSHWSYNYWARESAEHAKLPYPDDLDDTFCALIGLQKHDQTLIDGAALAKITKLLIATETKPGGPYRTWLVPKNSKKAWLDIDLAVNSNIACFLSMVSNPLPSLTAMMEQAITSEIFHSPYYPGAYQPIYFMSRAYLGPRQQTLADYLAGLRRANGSWETVLQTALAVSSLVRLGNYESLDKSVDYLLAAQQENGSWPAEAFCLDPAQKGQAYYSGSEALTTALVIEALSLYSKKSAAKTGTIPAEQPPKALSSLYQSVLAKAQRDLNQLPVALKPLALAELDKTASGKNSQEIILLPYFFARSLAGSVSTKNNPVLSKKLLQTLGLANLYGWIAYTIYDDFLDDEGDPKLLPVANVALRYSLANFHEALPESPDFQMVVSRTFDAIDSANAWEVANCRFKVKNNTLHIGKLPVYGNRQKLAERSLGHCLTPLGVLASLRLSPASQQALLTQKALRHYLIARQLNDDIHDWQDDVQRGHITYVVGAILKDLGLDRPQSLTLDSLLPDMQRIFWHQTLPQICRVMRRHVSQSRTALREANILLPDNIIADLLNDIESTVQETEARQKEAIMFLQTYSHEQYS